MMKEIGTPETDIESPERKSLTPEKSAEDNGVDKLEVGENFLENTHEISFDDETDSEKTVNQLDPHEGSNYRIDDELQAWDQAIAEGVQREATKAGIIPGEANSGKKGNFGEIVTDIELSKKGWTRISKDNYGITDSFSLSSYGGKLENVKLESDTVTSLSDKGHQGIDGVYQRVDKTTGEVEYCIIESKYGTSKMGTTADGKQMGHKWLGIDEESSSQ